MRVKGLMWAALALVLLTGILLRASHIHDAHRLTPNERAYLYYAAKMHDQGVGVTTSLFREYENDPGLWAVAQPVRIGYVFILDAVMTVMGTTTVNAGMALSFVASALTLLLVAWLGIRFFNPWVSLIASALCATAFTEIWLVRGTPEDGVFGLFGLVEIWITCEIMRSPRRWWLYVPFHLVGIGAILVKQSGIFIYGFSAAWLIGFLWFQLRERRQAILVAAGLVAGIAIACGIFVVLAGNPPTAWRVFLLSFISNAEAWSYNEECCFGPWTQMPRVLFALSPLTFLLALTGIAMLVALRKWNPALPPLTRGYGALCAIMAIGFVCLFTFFPGMEVLRFITPGQGAICLVAGIGLWNFLSIVRPHLVRIEYSALLVLVAGGVVWSMVRDYAVFHRVEMAGGIPELGAALIRSALGI